MFAPTSSACNSQRDTRDVKVPKQATAQSNPATSPFTGMVSQSMTRSPEGGGVGQVENNSK